MYCAVVLASNALCTESFLWNDSLAQNRTCAQVVPICLSLRVRCYRRFLPILDLSCWQNVACEAPGLFLRCFRNFGKRCSAAAGFLFFRVAQSPIGGGSSGNLGSWSHTYDSVPTTTHIHSTHTTSLSPLIAFHPLDSAITSDSV